MRITSGDLRGRSISSLEGTETRPTSDKVKQSMFNIIQFDIYGRYALDLFAGTGQLGIEAVSRGAKTCVFVEQEFKTAKHLSQNIENFGIDTRCQVVEQDCIKFLSKNKGSFNLVFMDPPYLKDGISNIIRLLCENDFLKDDAIVLAETDINDSVPEIAGRLHLEKTYKHGRTAVHLYKIH